MPGKFQDGNIKRQIELQAKFILTEHMYSLQCEAENLEKPMPHNKGTGISKAKINKG